MAIIKPVKAILWLIFLNIVWGFSFPFMDYLLDEMSPFVLMFIRYGISAIIMIFVFIKPIMKTSKKDMNIILLISVFSLLGMFAQVIGLAHSNSTNAAFITSLSVLCLPIILKVFEKTILGKKMIIGIVFATVGISLMTIQANMTFSKGDVIVFFGMICFSFLYYTLGKYGNRLDAGVLATVEFVIIAVVSAPFAINDGFHFELNFKTIAFFVFLTLVCTIFAGIMHNYIQHYIPTAIVGIIFLIEPISASIMAWFMGDEISTRQLFGAIIVVASVVFTMELAKGKQVDHGESVFEK